MAPVLKPVALLVFASTALAGPASAQDGCRKPTDTFTIPTCTAIIETAAEPIAARAFAFDQRGRLLFGRDDRRAALADFEEAIRLNPGYAPSYNARGYLLEDTAPERSLADYSRAIELEPALVIAYNNRGALLRDRGDLDGAIRDLDMAVRLDPNSGAALLDRALAREARNDLAGALADTEAAIVLAPSYQPAKDQRARLQARMSAKP